MARKKRASSTRKTRRTRSPAAPRAHAAKDIYFFGQGKADGTGGMGNILGGKGAGLADMTAAGLPVPPGFTISTQVCREFLARGGKTPARVHAGMEKALRRLEKVAGRKFGALQEPLLVSVRSGAEVSMPGMMDTILNLGLNDDTVVSFAEQTANPRFAWDCYRRLIQMFSDIALAVPMTKFDRIFDAKKKSRGVEADTALGHASLEEIVAEYKALIKKETGKAFPQDPRMQLRLARDAVFRSWNTPRAMTYRKLNKISDDLGTAVSVQQMVFGNMGDDCGTGVAFTRDPSTGERKFFGEFLFNAQGEDVVAGIRTPLPIADLERRAPTVYKQLIQISKRLERHYRDMQDFEFTMQEGRLFMLQTRSGKRTGRAALRIASDMVEERLITPTEALLRVEPRQLEQLLHPVIDQSKALTVIGTGLPASPGAAVGQVVFSPDQAAEKAQDGPVVLVRDETVPDDIHGMAAAEGILTARGGMTSHAAVVARGMGKCCVAGCEALRINEAEQTAEIGGATLKAGDWLSLDGNTGRIILGQAQTVDPDLTTLEFARLMQWSDKHRRLRVRANADIPVDAQVARNFGAEGIGLCRTEHMFFGEDRLRFMREMILATDVDARREALSKLLPMQRDDFKGLFRVMNGYPVTVRFLDPPLHEFLPRPETVERDLAAARSAGDDVLVRKTQALLDRVRQLQEQNPMLGTRGCRLGILHPEITEMQAQAIFEAACEVSAEGVKTKLEVMIPLVGNLQEFQLQKKIVIGVARKVFREKGRKVGFLVGTMIELPRAALTAGEIAQDAEFFSFGTNDLTQTTLGLSRDDTAMIIQTYIDLGVFPDDPFQTIDLPGVGSLVRQGTENGRAVRPNLKVGICGEHGGDPASIEFCHSIGLDYVSCSPYRIPVARLAAARAALKEKLNQL